MSSHDIVSGALACAAGPSGAAGLSRSGDVGSSSAGSSDQNCATIASIANVSPQGLRTADKSTTDKVKDFIQQQAKNENLSGSMKDQLTNFYDRGISAIREMNDADGVLAPLLTSGAMGGGPSGAMSGTTSSAAGRQRGASAAPTLSSSDADKVRTHDKLRDLVQFAHSSNAGPVASEAEGLAWLVAAQRFTATSQLPPRLKVLAAEPLFDTLLGVPTPAAAKGDPSKIPNNLWSQYLNSAARSAREGGMGAASGIGGGASAATSAASGAAQSAGAGSTRVGRAAAAGKDATAWREVVTVVEQRIESLSQQLPPSDLRQTLSDYAQQLRTESVGGGPMGPQSAPMQHPMIHHGGMTNPPSGNTPPRGGSKPNQGGSTNPDNSGSGSPGGSGSPSGGSGSPGGGSGSPGGGANPNY